MPSEPLSKDSAPAYIDSRLPKAVQERLAVAPGYAQSLVNEIASDPLSKPKHAKVNEALVRASTASNPNKAILWLNEAADHLGDLVRPKAACKEGCSHCCHIPVPISRKEAVYIGRAIGVTPVNLPNHALGSAPDTKAGYENPCTFLENNRCSVFEDRPTTCRTHFNLDRDNLLCELQPGIPVEVPYLNPMSFAAVQAQLSRGLLADIRRWFPKDIVAKKKTTER